MSDICSWIFAGGHSPVLGQGHKQKDGVKTNRTTRKLEGKKKKNSKKKYYMCEEIGKCDT